MSLRRCTVVCLRCGVLFQPPRARMASSKSHYETLGVERDATKAEIKSAFLTLSKKHHPDRHPASKSQLAHENFREVNEAYTVLIDPAKRSAYDRRLYGEPSQSPFTSRSSADEKFGGFYQYNPHANAYSYARAYKYYDLSEAEWEELRKKSGAFRPKASNFRVLRLLVVLMVSGSLLHGVRIYYSHQSHQRRSLEESERNLALYEAVRERGRNSTLQQQLDALTDSHRKNTQILSQHSKTTKSTNGNQT